MSENEPTIRVVVADDQAIVRDGLVTVLDLLPDIEVVGEAADGEQAVALVAREQPDVVLMDLRMPVLDGSAATARIVSEHPGTAVLVLTTFADDASVMGALRAGARGYLTKDATRAEVAAAVRSVARGQTTLSADVGARLIGGLTGSAHGTGPLPDSSGTGPSSLSSGAMPSSGRPELPGSHGAGDRSAQHGAGQHGAGQHGGVQHGFAPGTTGAGASQEGARGPSPEQLRARHPQLTAREAEVLALVAQGHSNTEIASALFVSVATVKTHINSLFSKLQVRDRAQVIALARS
jgi:DNA-binding NarL/FixJ family response regulator